MYILIIILPLTSFLFLSSFSYFLKKKDLLISSISLMILAWFCSIIILFEVNIGLSTCVLNLGILYNLSFLYCPILLLYDDICSFMCFVVLSISCLVHVYSIEYMKSDLFICRFISYLSLFTFFMLILITAGTIIQLFIGWEGVGLPSYLLINFWFTRIQASKAALKAIVMNRFGDIGLYSAIIILINWYGSFDLCSLSLLFQYEVIYNVFPQNNHLVDIFKNDYYIYVYNNPYTKIRVENDLIETVHFWGSLKKRLNTYVSIRIGPSVYKKVYLLFLYDNIKPSCLFSDEFKQILFIEKKIMYAMDEKKLLSYKEVHNAFKIAKKTEIWYAIKDFIFTDINGRVYFPCVIKHAMKRTTFDIRFCHSDDWESYAFSSYFKKDKEKILEMIINNEPYISKDQVPLWLLEILGFCILLAAIGKSAQIGLHTWLPDATEGPTPVSALIHAATMVTAGVFILIRFYFILENLSWILICVSLIGAITVFFAGTIGSFQYDLKKVIAYSTCSQLGYMVFTCGLSNYNISLFHLLNHAFFKALLLLGAGAIIHSILDEQDMRKMGGLYKAIPLTYISISLSSLALIGLPFLSGFYSKDILLENAFSDLRIDSIIGYILCFIGIGFTLIYSFKLFFFVFFNGVNLKKKSLNIHDTNLQISLVLIILVILSICGGFIMKEWTFFSCYIYNFWLCDNLIISEFLFVIIKNLPFTLIFIIIILCSLFWQQWTLIIYFYHFFNQKWYFDLFYNNFLCWICVNYSYFITFKLIDRAILETWGSLGVSNLINISETIQGKITGYIYHYIFILWNFCIWIFFFLELINFKLDFFFFFSFIFITYIFKQIPNVWMSRFLLIINFIKQGWKKINLWEKFIINIKIILNKFKL